MKPIDEILSDASGEVMADDLSGTFYRVDRWGLILFEDATPGMPVQVRRYPSPDALQAAWDEIQATGNWVQGV